MVTADRSPRLAAGPDVWEIVGRLQELDGGEEQRISLVAAESDLHRRAADNVRLAGQDASAGWRWRSTGRRPMS
jgi:hypothetical protein